VNVKTQKIPCHDKNNPHNKKKSDKDETSLKMKAKIKNEFLAESHLNVTMTVIWMPPTRFLCADFHGLDYSAD
jgi:hypothetical protein